MAPAGEIVGDGHLVVPVAVEIEPPTVPDQRGDGPVTQLRHGGHDARSGQAGRPGVRRRPRQAVRLLPIELGEPDGHVIERRAHVAVPGGPGRHGQGQQFLCTETGLQAEHRGGELHLVGPEHAGLDEGGQHPGPGGEHHGTPAGTDDRAKGHATPPPGGRPSRRSLSETTSVGGTAHPNTPAGSPGRPLGPAMPRRNR